MQYNYLPDYVVSTAAPRSTSPSRARAPVALRALDGRRRRRALSVGDQVNIIGATQPEYNGFVTITGKPDPDRTFSYDILGAPITPADLAPGYTNIQVVTSAAYCRSGTGAGACTPQAMNITSAGTVITGQHDHAGRADRRRRSRRRHRDQHGRQFCTAQRRRHGPHRAHRGHRRPPGTSSDPYYGVFTITKPNATTITYTINAVAGVTPVTATGDKRIIHSALDRPLPRRRCTRPTSTASPTTPPSRTTAPKKADGTPLTNPGTDANGNYAYNAIKWATQSVERDPFHAYEVAAGVTPMWAGNPKDNLSRVAVPLYCNTDWPMLVNDPNGPATALDAGDANGQYQATKGAWCRINGTPYDASAASGAPATAVAGVEMGYNYPWQKSSGVDDPKYFYRQLSNKITLVRQHFAVVAAQHARSPAATAARPSPSRAGRFSRQCNKQGNVCNPVAASRNYNAGGVQDRSARLVLRRRHRRFRRQYARHRHRCRNALPATASTTRRPPPPGRCSVTNAACNDRSTAYSGGNLANARTSRARRRSRAAPAAIRCTRRSAARRATASCSIRTPTPTWCRRRRCSPTPTAPRRGLPPQQPDVRHQRRAGGGRTVHLRPHQHRRRLPRQQGGRRHAEGAIR